MLVDVLAVVVIGVLVALVVHELAHWLAARAFGATGVRLRWGPWRATVEADFDSDVERIWFLLAGPIASFAFGLVLVVMGGWWPSIMGAVSVLLGVLTLAGSDGRQAWALARTRAKSNDSR